jgi:hypothetical protein
VSEGVGDGVEGAVAACGRATVEYLRAGALGQRQSLVYGVEVGGLGEAERELWNA